MSEITFREEKQSADFEIVLLERDRLGNPTGKKISYMSNEGSKICEFHDKHCEMQKAKMGKNKRKRRNKKQGK